MKELHSFPLPVTFIRHITHREASKMFSADLSLSHQPVGFMYIPEVRTMREQARQCNSYRLLREAESVFSDRTRGARRPGGAIIQGCFRDNMNRPNDLIREKYSKELKILTRNKVSPAREKMPPAYAKNRRTKYRRNFQAVKVAVCNFKIITI
jgi:hypothetical protein